MTLYAQVLKVDKYTTTEPMKVAVLAHGAVTMRKMPPYVPSTTLFGAWLAQQISSNQIKKPPRPHDVLNFLKKQNELHFYPALLQVEGMLGTFQCEKTMCTLVDFASLGAYTASIKPTKPRLELRVGIYIDRAAKTGKYGAFYTYTVAVAERDKIGLVTAAPPLGQRLQVGYKKTYGLGEAEVEKATPVAPVKSNKFLLLAPTPISTLTNLKIKAIKVKYYPRYYIYLLITNRFYVVGRHFDEPYAAPGTEITLEDSAHPF